MISYKQIGGSGGAAVGDTVKYHDKAFSDRDLGKGVDNYYIGEQAKGSWKGKTAELLGLDGKPVTKEKFRDLLMGIVANEKTGEVTDLSKTGKDRRAGYDFTIAPPKSVSIIGLVGGDKRVIAAHLAAQDKAMAALEKYGAMVRIKKDGRTVHKMTGNLLYMSVSHETNRFNECHIHTHNVVAAISIEPGTDQVRSLTNDQLLEIRRACDRIYQADMVASLHRLGFETRPARDGSFEIAGLTDKQIEAFQFRTLAINAKLVEWGIDPDKADYKQREAAALATRPAKHDLPRDELLAIWVEKALEVGIDFSKIIPNEQEIEQRLAEGKDGGVQQVDPGSVRQTVAAVAWAVEHLSERNQTFAASSMIDEALRFGQNAVCLEDVENVMSQFVRDGVLIERTTSEGMSGFTTPQAVRNEQVWLSNVKSGQGQHNVVVESEKVFADGLKEFYELKSQELGKDFALTQEQKEAAHALLMHGDSTQIVQGDAGTGKTTALEFVRFMAEKAGWQIIGLSSPASATKELEKGSGIESFTVAAFKAQRENAQRLISADIEKIRDRIESTQRSGNTMLYATLKPSGLGKARYAFDMATGGVYKTEVGTKAKIGELLMAGARDHQGGKIGEVISDFRVKFGNRLVQFTKAEMAEGVAARSALYASLPKVFNNESQRDAIKQYQEKAVELANLIEHGNVAGANTIFVMDETGLTGVKDLAEVSSIAREINARDVYVGDIKQLDAVAAGNGQAQVIDEVKPNISYLKEHMRFNNACKEVKFAVDLKGVGRYKEAFTVLPRYETSKGEVASKAAERYMFHYERLTSGDAAIADPKIDIVTLTNADRKDANEAVHKALVTAGVISREEFVKDHLDNPKLTEPESMHAHILDEKKVDTIYFESSIRKLGIAKGEIAQLIKTDAKTGRLQVRTDGGRDIWFDPKHFSAFTPMRSEKRSYSAGDKVSARAIIQTPKDQRITNGTEGAIVKIDEKGADIRWNDGLETRLDNDSLKLVDHSYAKTTYREQGASPLVEIFASERFGIHKFLNQKHSEVILTRAKDVAEIVTSAWKTLLKNAERSENLDLAIPSGSVKKEVENEAPKGKTHDGVQTDISNAMVNAVDNILREANKGVEPERENRNDIEQGM